MAFFDKGICVESWCGRRVEFRLRGKDEYLLGKLLNIDKDFGMFAIDCEYDDSDSVIEFFNVNDISGIRLAVELVIDADAISDDLNKEVVVASEQKDVVVEVVDRPILASLKAEIPLVEDESPELNLPPFMRNTLSNPNVTKYGKYLLLGLIVVLAVIGGIR